MKKSYLLTLVLIFAALFTTQVAAVAQAPTATAEEAVTALLNRIGGDGAADKFEIFIDGSLAENGKDVFVITSQNDKPCIKGNTQLSVATGINWYLNHYAHINLTWNNLTTDLTSVYLPLPAGEEKHVCNTTYRYDFNTCTFSYSMAFWTWERWQQEIDWMALHGINAPLNLVGLDVVTRNFLKELGVSDSDIAAYIAGPGFIAWFAMNNLEGWGGTINSASTGVDMSGNPDWWYTRQEQLCKNMLQRMRELGMQPVIPGFSGQVPNCIVNYSITGFSSGDVVNNGTWAGGYTRPDILKPNTESYRTFAAVYYKHLHEVMGVSELYSMDPFHEGSLPSGVTNATCYPNIMAELDVYHDAVTAEDKEEYNVTTQPKWIIQYWQGVPQDGAFSAMESYGDRFIGLDLFSDNIYAGNAAKWRDTGSNCHYQGRPYIYCMLHNFGGRSGLHGRLETTMDGYFQALANNNNCQGIGATPEGTETNPILYDMLFELPWMDPANRPTADEWLEDYAYARYGIENDTALAALQNLKKSVWNCEVNQQGTSEAVILARPNWTIGSVSSWSTAVIYWDTQDVRLAADQLISIADLIKNNNSADGTANYNYDAIDVIRQAMVDYAAELLPLINAARSNEEEYTRLYQLYLQLMLDLDTMLSYDENFKLERWTSLARNIADEVNGTTENDRNWLEWNARTQVTVWSKGNTDLHDYSNRCWAGLIKDFHYKRWEKFFTTKGGSFDGGWFSGFEYPWTVDFNETYDLAGDYSQIVIPNDMTATEKAVETFGKYFGRVKGATKNFIFPMGVTTDGTKSDVIPEVYRGQTVELPLIIGKDVTVSSVQIDLNGDGAISNAENLTADEMSVAIPADAAIGKTEAIVEFSDGTVITFNLAIVVDITANRTVTAATADPNMGTVAIEGDDDSDGSITNMETVKITATANTGYNFKNWTDALTGNVVSNDNPYIYYGETDASFTANFIQDKWGVPTQTASGLSDATTNKQYVNDISLAYYKREAESIYSVATNGTPTSLFITVPQIIDVPQGASFTISWSDNGEQNLTKCFMSAYMDFNANGDFSEEGELVKVVGTWNADNSAVRSGSMEILLPYDAPLGITHLRMRFDSAWGSEYNSGTGAFNPKGQLDRMCYEIVLNITDKTDKAAHVTVKTNSEEWGTVEVWTDETPDGSTGTEWDVSSNIPLYLRATKSTPDTEFLGWYDHYGRLLTTELEYTMYAREDATYTARFRKFLEIDGWQIEYRTEPGTVVKTKKLASGVKPENGKTYYIYAPTRPTNDGDYVNRYLYNNNGTLSLNTTASGDNYLWTCSVDGENYTFQNVGDPAKYLAHRATAASPYNFTLGTGVTQYEGITIYSVNDGRFLVTKDDGTGFDQSTRVHNQSTENYTTDYVFTEVYYPDNVIFTEVRKSGNHDLVIPETVEILGEQCPIIGFDNGVFTDNKDLWSISLPATIETMSNNRVFKAAIPGKGANASGDTSNYITTDLGTTLAPGEDWAISLTIEDNGNNFNQWGSALIATGDAPMNSTYANGFQLYMQSTSNGGKLIVKLDNNNNNNALASISKGTKYRIDIVYTHSNTQLVVTATSLESQASLAARRVAATRATNSLTLTQDMSGFSTVSHAIPEGVNITNLEVSKGAVPDPFEGCTNLMAMTVDNSNENYYVANRTLYTTSGTDLHELADEEKAEELRALGELIDDTEALIEQIATIDPIGTATEIAMTTTEGSDYYIWCNNPHGDNTGNLEHLLDDDATTFFHSNWSSISSIHDYLQVNFGTAAGLDNFKIAGQQRHNATDDRPKNIEIYGSNDNTNWTPIDTVTDLSNSNGATWESDLISVDTRYSYLKFIVKTYNNYNQTNSVSRPYFHMAKFDLYKVTSSAEVAPKYKNLAGITNEETANVYDKLVEALYVYNNGGTADEMQAAYDALKPLYDGVNAKVDNIFEGVYNINYKDAPIFVAYTTTAVESMSNDVAGYKLFDTTLDGTDAKHQTLQNDAIAAKVAADALFTIVPNSELTGYTISAQGLYLHSTRNGGWAPQLLSGDANQAGVYLFEETEANIYKLKSNRNDIEYVNDWGPIFGNDKSIKENLSTFTLTQVTEYTLNVPEGGFTTLCLPFNVVLPAGVTAYDLTEANLTDEGLFYTYELTTVASEGNTLAKNTPVIIKANAGDYVLTITMDDEGAKASTEGTLLRSGLVKTTIDAGSKYIYDGDNFNIVTTTTNIAANQCWMELDESKGDIIYGEAPAYVLTTDEDNPVLYNIQVNRDFNNPTATYLEYNEITGVVNVVAATENDSYQAWYFVAGENGAVQIKPYNGDGKVLGADDNSDGGTKVWAVEKDSKAIDEWTIEQFDTEWYNILGDGKCFSNHGAANSGTMGFYNVKSDPGSKFKFIPATFGNNNPRFYQMKDLNANTTAFVGTSVGCYTEESVNILNTAKTNASTIEATGDTSDANSCYDAYKAIRTAKENIEYIAPDPEKVYYIVSTATNEYCAGKYVHTYREPHIHNNATWGDKAYDQKHLLYDAKLDIEPMSLAAFQFEETGTVGEYKMKNLHTGLYVKSFNNNAEHMGTEAEAQVVTISAIANGQVTLKIGNASPMHAQNDYGVIVTWGASVSNASTWSINEITDLADLNYTIEVPEEGVTTLDLAFNVVLPEGVTAYDVVESDITENAEANRFEYTLTEIATAGDVLAKNTPVIIKATAGEYTFAATMNNENVKGAANNSVLKGSFVNTTIGTDVSNYMLAINDGDIIFQLVETDSTEVVANTAWMELDGDKGQFIYEVNSEVIETVMPVAGGVYRIKNFVDKTAEEYKTHYVVNKNLSISLPTSVSEDDKSAMWVCASDTDGNYTFVSAMGTVAFGWRGIAEDAIVLTISEGVKPGALTLTKDSNINLALTTEGYNNSGKAALNQYTGNKYQIENASTDWYFEEVTDAGVAFETTIQANYKWATMYLPYTVAIPEGVEAYYATQEDIDGRIINLTPLEDYIPKNTAVLLYREECSTTESYSFTQANERDAVADNLFKGKILKTAIDAASDKIYLLLRYNSREAFYWMAEEYDENCNPGSGYVKCDANKAYFTMPKESPSSASYYSFRYEGTTNIDDKILEEVVADDEAVYDLQGRKVLDTIKGGIYIKAGKKFIAE